MSSTQPQAEKAELRKEASDRNHYEGYAKRPMLIWGMLITGIILTMVNLAGVLVGDGSVPGWPIAPLVGVVSGVISTTTLLLLLAAAIRHLERHQKK